MSFDLLIISLFLLPPVLWALSHVLFWCFCWCFCAVENYFQDRFMQRMMVNLRRLERISEEKEAA